MAATVSGHSAIKYSRSPYLKRAFIPGRPVWILTRKAYLPLFLRLCVLLDQVEPLQLRNTWSFKYRPPRMGEGISDHAGYAIDCWSDGIGTHTWPSKMPKAKALAISKILKGFKTADGRHIFGWGACDDAPGVVYTGPTYEKHVSNDPMHFYIAPGITTRDAARVIKALRIKSDGTVK